MRARDCMRAGFPCVLGACVCSVLGACDCIGARAWVRVCRWVCIGARAGFVGACAFVGLSLGARACRVYCWVRATGCACVLGAGCVCRCVLSCVCIGKA